MHSANALRLDGQTAYFHSSEAMGEVPDASIRMCFTSPPYWDLKNYGHEGQIGQESYEKYLDRLCVVWEECNRVIAPNGLMFINVGNRRSKNRYYPIGWDIYRSLIERKSGWKLLENF